MSRANRDSLHSNEIERLAGAARNLEAKPIASLIRDMSSSSDLACVWQPGNAATVAKK